MTPELKAKWIAALRSGNYQQGIKKLRGQDNRCCCLGVLCDIASPDRWRPTASGSWAVDGFTGVPSTDRYTEWGLRTSDVQTLVDRNDNGNSFKRIADWIEVNL